MKTRITRYIARFSRPLVKKYSVRSRISLTLIGIACIGLVGILPAQTGNAQNVLHVKADAVGANNGTNWADAYSDLQDALAAAVVGDQIWVARGMYTPGGPGDRNATFQLKNGVGVYGGFAGIEDSPSERDPGANVTVLSGDLNGNDRKVLETTELVGESTRSDNSYHVVTGSGADETAVLDGFLITGGNANASGHFNGGGMINEWKAPAAGRAGASGPESANPTLVNCSFHRNSASHRGGGIYNEAGIPTLIDCVLSENHANGTAWEEGGGGMHNQGGSPTLRSCRFVGNTAASSGAGLHNRRANPTIIDTVFDGNVIVVMRNTHVGGGMLNEASDATIVNCTFTGNSAPYGGGIWNTGLPSPTIVNCIFTGNEAVNPGDGAGGGIQNWGGGTNPTVINCTFSENTAVQLGAGLGANAGARAVVSNCIFWGNHARAGANEQIGGVGGDPTVVTWSCVQGGKPGAGNIDLDPLFLDADGPDDIIGTPDDDLRFGRGSPCFDGGDDGVLPLDTADLDGDGDTSERIPLDLAGNPRSYGDWVDMGAYEYTPADAFPINQATDVFRDVVLTWKTRGNFQTYDVYFGTSAQAVATADAANPLDVLISTGQDTTFIDPGQLEFGGSYYWRVDHVNGAPDFSVTRGAVRSFTVEPIAQPITPVSVLASSSFGLAYVPERTIDGSGMTEDLHGVAGGDMWISAELPATLEFAFDQAYRLHALWIWNANQLIESILGLGAKDIVIEHSLDGENWTVLDGVAPLTQAPGTAGYGPNNTIDFGDAMAQQVRVTIKSVYGSLPRASLSEVRFYAAPLYARNPHPADGSTTDSTDVVLNWVPGRVATSHDVLLSENLEAIADGSALIANTTDAWFDLSDLDLAPNTTYYWQVNEVTELGDPPVYEGTVWHFTTP